MNQEIRKLSKGLTDFEKVEHKIEDRKIENANIENRTSFFCLLQQKHLLRREINKQMIVIDQANLFQIIYKNKTLYVTIYEVEVFQI